MMDLTARQYLIIKFLKESGTSVPSTHLCSDLGVSSRTLRYEISAINKAVDCNLIKSNRDGYFLDSQLDSCKILENIRFNDYLDVVKSVTIFLVENENSSIYDIEESCYISESVILSILKQISYQMEKFDLRINKRGQFIRVEGTEFDKRKYLVHLFFSDIYGEITFNNIEKDYFKNVSIADIQALVTETMQDMGICLDDIYLKHIVISTAVSLQRIISGHITEKQPALIYTGEENNAYLFLTSLLERAYHKYTIKVGEEDFKGLLCFYTGSFRDNNLSFWEMTVPNNKSFETTVRKIVDETLKHFNLHVNYEPLFDRLVMHVYFLLLRAKAASFVKNEISSSIKQSNPFIYDVSVYMAYLLQMEFKVAIPDEEIGLLAIYFGSVILNSKNFGNKCDVICVCPKYNNLREQIESQILNMFNAQVNIQKFVSRYSQINEDDQYDFIISTISNSYSFKDIVYVSPIIGPWEYQKINAKIIECIKKRQRNEIKSLVLKYFHPDLFFYNADRLTGMEILQFLDEKMEEKNIVSNEFLANVLKREKLASTAFFNKFAIPHAMNANAKETKIAYYYSEKPIRWFESDVNLVLLIATKDYDQEFVRLYELIFELLMNKDLYYRLIGSSTFDMLVENISNQI